MNCPICQNSLTDSNAPCPSCGSDLTLYTSLDSIGKQMSSQKRNTIIISLVAVVLLIATAGFAYKSMDATKGPDAASLKQIEELKKTNTELQGDTKAIQDKLDKTIEELEALKQQEPEETEADIQEVTEPISHLVIKGETLISISMKYFGTPQYYERIGLQNKIADPERMQTGSTLIINPI